MDAAIICVLRACIYTYILKPYAESVNGDILNRKHDKILHFQLLFSDVSVAMSIYHEHATYIYTQL